LGVAERSRASDSSRDVGPQAGGGERANLASASDLLANGFAPPAAVLAGSVLEEHTRKLAAANGVQTKGAKGRPGPFDTLAVELTKPGTILETERKSLVAWYGLRTAGAHGRHAEVVADP
jgi:hypothetical protein